MVRIKDVAAKLGVSSTTVSNVIHGKTNRVSPELVAKIREVLEQEHYVPNMAGVLLAQSNSKIVAIILSNDIKYGDRIIQDPFISEMLAGLEESIKEKGYFTMLHNTRDIDDVARIATMWNVAGVVLFGFEKEDYDKLRQSIKIPFVSVDGYFDTQIEKFVNIGIDDHDGGYQMGRFLLEMGHKKILYLSDNHVGGYKARLEGLKEVLESEGIKIDDDLAPLLSINDEKRREQIKSIAKQIITGEFPYTAIFFSSDRYAIEAMNMFQDEGVKVPEQISVVGFDDTAYASVVRPYLTTVRQDTLLKSVVIINTLMNLINKYEIPSSDLRLPVEVIVRESVSRI